MTALPDVPRIDTMRLVLRGWREDDLEPLGRILADSDVTRFLFDGPLGEEDVRAALHRRIVSWRERGVGFWAVELKQTGELIGWAGLQHVPAEDGYVGEIEIGWTLGRRWWGQGLATEAAEAALAYGFSDLGLERIYAFYMPNNQRSQRVMIRLGMEPAGKTRDLRDGAVSNVYALTAERWAARVKSGGRPNPHGNAGALAAGVGYECERTAVLLTSATPGALHEALLGALVRTWPGRALPGEPHAYEAAGDPGDMGVRISAERSSGRFPLLIVAPLPDPASAGKRLASLHAEATREGLWLHADAPVRHGVEFENLSLADSIAFDVPTPFGRRRLFATRHPRILDAAFLTELGLRANGEDDRFG